MGVEKAKKAEAQKTCRTVKRPKPITFMDPKRPRPNIFMDPKKAEAQNLCGPYKGLGPKS